MPIVYTAHCPTCGERFQSPDMNLAIQLDDGSLVPLRHPLGEHDLTNAGFTWEQAHDEARIVRCEYLVCDRCGGLYEARSRTSSAGRLSVATGAAAMAITAAAAVWLLWRFLWSRMSEPSVRATLISLAVIGVAAGIAWFGRTHYRNRHARPELRDARCCKAATPDTLVGLSDATWRRKPFPCSGCGGQTVSVRATGVS